MSPKLQTRLQERLWNIVERIYQNRWSALVAQLVAVLIAFEAGLSPRLQPLVILALAMTSAGYWLVELRIRKAEQQKQPRSLSVDERQAWTETMRRFASVKARVYGVASDFESQAFGGSIINILQSAGLIVEPKKMMFPTDVMPDVAVFIDKSHEHDLIGEAGWSFFELVRGKELVCFAASVPDPGLNNPQRVDPGMVHIHVGPRHFSLIQK